MVSVVSKLFRKLLLAQLGSGLVVWMLSANPAEAICATSNGGADLTLDATTPCLGNNGSVGTVTVTGAAQALETTFAPSIIANDALASNVYLRSVVVPSNVSLSLSAGAAQLFINSTVDNGNSLSIDSIINRGSLVGDWVGINLSRFAGGTLARIGIIENYGTMNFSLGSIQNTGGSIGTIKNAGTIGSGSSLPFVGITNNAGTIGSIENSGTIGNVSNTSLDGAISNYTDGQIGTITNTGFIYGIYNHNSTITTINNGGLITRFNEILPTNYNIIIQSPTSYGKLQAIDPSDGNIVGATRFGIYPGSSVVAGTYAGVLQGFNVTNIDPTTLSGTYRRFEWQLSDADNDLSWDLFFRWLGPNPENTVSALTTSAYQVRDQLNARGAMMTTLLGYDTNAFGPNNVSIQFVARYNSVFSETNQGAGALVAAYRFAPSFRVGAFVDYAPWNSSPAGIQQNDNQPSFGAFAVYEQNPDLTGFLARGAVGYNKGRLTVTRSALLEDTEPGTGRANLTTFGAGVELGYGVRIAPQLVAIPNLGLRYTDAGRSSYTEWQTDIVLMPLSYNSYAQRLTTGTAGVRLQGFLGSQFGYFVSLGAEYDFARTMDTYSGTSNIDGLTTFSVSTNTSANRLRAAAGVGLSYQTVSNQKISAEVGVRQLAYSADPSISALLKYSVGF